MATTAIVSIRSGVPAGPLIYRPRPGRPFAYGASLGTALGVFDLDFWWEVGALISIMLLGHWQEMKALGQAQEALAALAALLPDEAERVRADGSVETVPTGDLQVGGVVLVRSGSRVAALDSRGRCSETATARSSSALSSTGRPLSRALIGSNGCFR